MEVDEKYLRARIEKSPLLPFLLSGAPPQAGEPRGVTEIKRDGIEECVEFTEEQYNKIKGYAASKATNP